MALWGTLRQRIGGGATPADSDAFVDDFFKKTKQDPTWELERMETLVNEFISNQLVGNRRGIALVTSGATIVPLDANNDTFVDLSAKIQEHQGPACAEYLLHLGYAVVFLHREDSMQPFTRHFQKYIQNGAFMSMLRVRDQGLVVEGLDLGQQVRFQNITLLYNDAKDRLLNISFTTVQQYLMLLRVTARAVNAANNRGIVILAATVGKFYVPTQDHDLAKKKKGEFSVNFVRVPNLIKRVRKEWCPKAFLVTLKHEFQDGQMIEAAHGYIEKYGVNVIAGTYRTSEYAHEILLITEQEDTIVSCPEDEDINDAFASAIAGLHRNFRKKREILQKGKQLLLLSAKFSMLKEKDLINEDANGNKNVKFGKGVKICTDRHRPDGAPAPVYELKHIFQNKSRCARAHVWESSVEHKSGHSTTDVVVAFSPAGNPETIRDVWGDFWSGWAEDEISEFKRQMGTVSLTSALNVVTSSISGDYSPASAILQFMWSKIGSAWSEGEQTRIRQSIQNMMAVGLDRGLIEADGLTPLEKLMTRPRIQRFDSLVVDQPPVSNVHSHSRRRRRDSDESSSDSSNPVRLSRARKVRVHRAVHAYLQDMLKDGLLDTIIKYVEQGAAVHITGYSMGGMLSQLFMLYLGDRARMQDLDVSQINMVGFGSPRCGDIGFAARLRVLFDPEQVIIVMHPSDTVHAFPPTAEGYADAAVKIFLKEDGWGVGRRTASPFSLLPMTRSIDSILERGYKSSSTKSDTECTFCLSKAHSTEQHRCRYCTERGTHRGANCPNRKQPCLLCGNKNHCTGEHRCKVCQQYGHRGRECHAQRDVGLTELVTYFRFHHFLYYNSNLKKSVEFTAT
uniref:Fungal lipase-type domain-containing protein n=1 Tax=Globisporangium ultimum (strain ATCC 200006 / CBS 805.95 / DAOM BR144) TaxID=431595 RepID=K3WKA7_GLOUD